MQEIPAVPITCKQNPPSPPAIFISRSTDRTGTNPGEEGRFRSTDRTCKNLGEEGRFCPKLVCKFRIF
jgi:hypothetical protein